MDKNFDKALAKVLVHEGGWADHPSDPGGATMKGVTIGNFRRFVKPNATKADLRRITDEQIATVYRRHYWDVVLGAKLPGGVDYCVFDYAVNSGPSRAIKHLQEVVGTKIDGVIGPKTLAAIDRKGAKATIEALSARRLRFVQGLRTWKVFGKGWGRRIAETRTAALRMAS